MINAYLIEMFKKILFATALFALLLASGCTQNPGDLLNFGGQPPLPETPAVTSADAFSGTGSYECIFEIEGTEMRFNMKEGKIKIESPSDLTVIKSGYYYTLPTGTELWDKKELPEGDLDVVAKAKALQSYECKAAEIDDSLFDVPEDKIRTADEEEIAEPAEEPPSSVSECDEKTVALQKDLCYKELAIIKDDSSICNKLTILSISSCKRAIEGETAENVGCETKSTQDSKDSCYNDAAISANDESLCKMISSNSLGMKNECFKAVGIAMKDSSICAFMTYSTSTATVYARDECYSDIAKALADATICKKISGSFQYGEGVKTYTRDMCYANILEEVTEIWVCDNLIDKNMQSACYMDIAILEKNVEPCKKLPSAELIKTCVIETAKATSDMNICKILQGSDYQDCLIGMMDSNTTAELCENITLFGNKEDCYYKVATRSGMENVELCTKITFDGELRGECYMAIATATNNSDHCSELNAAEDRRTCFYTIAFNTMNLDLCEKMTTPYEKYAKCYSDIAAEAGDSFICESMKGTGYTSSVNLYNAKNQCYYNYALAKDDKSVCINIKDAALKADCDSNSMA